MSEPIEVLAAWANDTECSLDEANRRAATYAAFAGLIEAAGKFRAAQKAVEAGATLRKYRRRDSAGMTLDAALTNVGGPGTLTAAATFVLASKEG